MDALPGRGLFQGGEVFDEVTDFALGEHRGERRHTRGAAFTGFDPAFLQLFKGARGRHQGEFLGRVGFENASMDGSIGESDNNGFEPLGDFCVRLHDGFQKILSRLALADSGEVGADFRAIVLHLVTADTGGFYFFHENSAALGRISTEKREAMRRKRIGGGLGGEGCLEAGEAGFDGGFGPLGCRFQKFQMKLSLQLSC